MAQVEVSGVFGRTFSLFQRPEDEKCSDKSQILLVIHMMIVIYLPISGGIPVDKAFQDGVWYKPNLEEKV